MDQQEETVVVSLSCLTVFFGHQSSACYYEHGCISRLRSQKLLKLSLKQRNTASVCDRHCPGHFEIFVSLTWTKDIDSKWSSMLALANNINEALLQHTKSLDLLG